MAQVEASRLVSIGGKVKILSQYYFVNKYPVDIVQNFDFSLFRCPNLAVQEADDSDCEDEDSDIVKPSADNTESSSKERVISVRTDQKVESRWIGDPVLTNDQCKFFR